MVSNNNIIMFFILAIFIFTYVSVQPSVQSQNETFISNNNDLNKQHTHVEGFSQSSNKILMGRPTTIRAVSKCSDCMCGGDYCRNKICRDIKYTSLKECVCLGDHPVHFDPIIKNILKNNDGKRVSSYSNQEDLLISSGIEQSHFDYKALL